MYNYMETTTAKWANLIKIMQRLLLYITLK